MKIAIIKKDITPQKPVMQCGYVQRDHAYEEIHDHIFAIVAALQLKNEKMIWIGADMTGFNTEIINRIKENCAKQNIVLTDSNFIIGASHDHSAPVCTSPDDDNSFFGKGDPEYFEYLSNTISSAIQEVWSQEGIEVEAKYSSVLIDGLYSNRNDANKLSDKTVHLIGFFNKDTDAPVGLFLEMSCHNTVLGPKNYQLTGDLFGHLRELLQKDFNCPVLMAQGNAGDMGNRQYRTGQEFIDCENMAKNLYSQITRKKSDWEPISMEHVTHKHVCYTKKIVLDASIYPAKIEDFKKRLESTTDYTERKVLLSGIAGFEYKQALGSGEKILEMPADIYTFDDMQIVSIPGEPGSILGEIIKKGSKKPHCIVWGYTGSCNLGYMVDKEMYDTECQETNTTVYPAGMPEDYANYIVSQMR